MGKVGSSSLFKTLKAANINQPVYHIHSLKPSHYKQRWKDIPMDKLCLEHNGNFRQVTEGEYLSKRLKILLNQKKLKIITIVRDPVAQKISNFFQHIETYFPNIQKTFNSDDITTKDIIETFWSQKQNKAWLNLYYKNKPRNVFDWFEYELKKVLDIDICSINFPQNEGYKIVRLKERNIDILILKLERFDDCLQESITRFLSLDKFKIKKDNIGSKKTYSEAYAQFKEAINFPKEYLDKIYEHRAVRHFYSEEEIEQFKMKWQTKPHPS